MPVKVVSTYKVIMSQHIYLVKTSYDDVVGHYTTIKKANKALMRFVECCHDSGHCYFKTFFGDLETDLYYAVGQKYECDRVFVEAVKLNKDIVSGYDYKFE